MVGQVTVVLSQIEQVPKVIRNVHCYHYNQMEDGLVVDLKMGYKHVISTLDFIVGD